MLDIPVASRWLPVHLQATPLDPSHCRLVMQETLSVVMFLLQLARRQVVRK
jgi:hypothetical protein